jgi:hypothetical protein
VYERRVDFSDLVFSLSFVSGSRVHLSYSCDGWVCDLGVVDVSSIFGLVRGSGTFVWVLPTFVLVSRILGFTINNKFHKILFETQTFLIHLFHIYI